MLFLVFPREAKYSFFKNVHGFSDNIFTVISLVSVYIAEVIELLHLAQRPRNRSWYPYGDSIHKK